MAAAVALTAPATNAVLAAALLLLGHYFPLVAAVAVALTALFLVAQAVVLVAAMVVLVA
jgi:hypothetical protein